MDPDYSDEMVDHVVDFFDRVAPFYDAWAGGQHGRVASRLVDLAAPAKVLAYLGATWERWGGRWGGRDGTDPIHFEA